MSFRPLLICVFMFPYGGDAYSAFLISGSPGGVVTFDQNGTSLQGHAVSFKVDDVAIDAATGISYALAEGRVIRLSDNSTLTEQIFSSFFLGDNSDGDANLSVLTKIPEPSALALMLIAICSLSACWCNRT